MRDLPNIPLYHVDHLIAEGGTAKVYWGIDLRSGFPVYSIDSDTEYPRAYYGFTSFKVQSSVDSINIAIAPVKNADRDIYTGSEFLEIYPYLFQGSSGSYYIYDPTTKQCKSLKEWLKK